MIAIWLFKATTPGALRFRRREGFPEETCGLVLFGIGEVFAVEEEIEIDSKTEAMQGISDSASFIGIELCCLGWSETFSKGDFVSMGVEPIEE